MKKISPKKWMAGIAIAVMILLTLIVPPSRSKVSEGSTYNREPSGYAAWYAYMEQTAARGIKIQRWQKPFLKLSQGLKSPITLIRVHPDRYTIDDAEEKWIERGNHLILLGVNAQTTEAPFSSIISSEAGKVKIDTTRRREYIVPSRPDEELASGYSLKYLSYLNTAQNIGQGSYRGSQNTPNSDDIPKLTKLLSDEFGGIVWQTKTDKKGTLISSTTAYLAANAYQNESGNFKFLANLVTELKSPIYIDEYIHGYKDLDTETITGDRNWIEYLMKTPLFAGAVQALVVLVVLIIAQNRRFGAAIATESPSINNSQAYIEALSSVLQKAQRTEFVWKAIAKAEQTKLQQKLGIRNEDRETTIAAWVQQTGRPKTELEHLLDPPKEKISEQDLLTYLLDWQKVQASI